MQKKPYDTPRVEELGSVTDLTQENPDLDKCAGSGDQFLPSPPQPPTRQVYLGDCPVARD
jgi:hypothetical protein